MTLVSAAPLPSAYLGTKEGYPTLARVCYRCPDKAAGDAYASRNGLSVTHTLCPTCYPLELLVARNQASFLPLPITVHLVQP